VKGKTILNQSPSLAFNDPLFNGKLHKSFLVKLEQGKSYQIDHMSAAFDAYLYLIGPDGKSVAEDDDGGEGLNSRIIYRPVKSGVYRIVATSLNGKSTGPFQLIVQELGVAKVEVPDPKNPPVLPVAEGFKQPAKSKELTSYLKVKGALKDYITQGK